MRRPVAPVPLLPVPGIWYKRNDVCMQAQRGALFLDRDGVLVVERHFLRRVEDVQLRPEVVALVKRACVRGMAIAVTTNQSGLARGLFDWDAFTAVEAEIARQLSAVGVAVDMTVACPFHPDFTPGYDAQHAFWRKPGPGMLMFAGQQLCLDLRRSWMVGDRAGDLMAARDAGLAGGVFLTDVHPEEMELARGLETQRFAAQTMTAAQIETHFKAF